MADRTERGTVAGGKRMHDASLHRSRKQRHHDQVLDDADKGSKVARGQLMHAACSDPKARAALAAYDAAGTEGTDLDDLGGTAA